MMARVLFNSRTDNNVNQIWREVESFNSVPEGFKDWALLQNGNCWWSEVEYPYRSGSLEDLL